MRILLVHNRHRHAGGEDVAVEAQRSLLAAAGHDVMAFVTENPPGPLGAGAALAAAPWNPAAARRLDRVARRFRPEVAHVHNTWFALSAAVPAALARAGIPVVVTLHNYRAACANGLLLRDGRPCHDCVGTGPWRAVAHGCYRGSRLLSVPAAAAVAAPRWRGLWRAVAAVVVLDGLGAEVARAAGVPADRVVVVPNAVAAPGPRDRPPSAADEVVFAGRLSEEKGPELLVAAWRSAAPPGLRLTLYGDGPLRRHLAGHGLPGVRVAGPLPHPDLLEVLAGARALCVPSTCHEAGPLAPLEAAAAGTPLVVSDSVTLAPGVAEAGAGWVTAAGDPASLAAALGRLADGAAVDRAGDGARALWAARHRPEQALAALEALYARVAGPRGRT